MNSLAFLRRVPRAVTVLLALGSCSLVSAGTPQTGAAPAVPNTIAQRVVACTGCHGVHGEGSQNDGMIPRLAGNPAGYLLQQLKYFQGGQRHFATMEYVVRQLSPAYLWQIAGYWSRQDAAYRRFPVPAVSAQTMQRGEQLVLHGDPADAVPACNSCHGSKLAGVEPMVPGLLGLSYGYINSQLVAWRNHTRAAEGPYCMGVVANRMRDADIAAVSAWLASHQPPPGVRLEPASAQTTPLPGWCVIDQSGPNP